MSCLSIRSVFALPRYSYIAISYPRDVGVSCRPKSLYRIRRSRKMFAQDVCTRCLHKMFVCTRCLHKMFVCTRCGLRAEAASAHGRRRRFSSSLVLGFCICCLSILVVLCRKVVRCIWNVGCPQGSFRSMLDWLDSYLLSEDAYYLVGKFLVALSCQRFRPMKQVAVVTAELE